MISQDRKRVFTPAANDSTRFDLALGFRIHRLLQPHSELGPQSFVPQSSLIRDTPSAQPHQFMGVLIVFGARFFNLRQLMEVLIARPRFIR